MRTLLVSLALSVAPLTASAATKEDVKEARADLAEAKTAHARFRAYERKWDKKADKDKDTSKIDADLEGWRKVALADLRQDTSAQGEGEVQAAYRELLEKLAKVKGDKRGAVLDEILDELGKRVSRREARLDRLKKNT